MGLKRENGGRRCQGYSAVVIPRCGLCKGQLSTKSNAFCIDSSRNLTSQYLIRDHMVFHYKRLHSAKAVDCSAPQSRSTSVKLADQQRREKLKNKIAKCEEKRSVCEVDPPSVSRASEGLPTSTFTKSFLEAEDSHLPCAGQAQCLSRAPSPHGEHCLVHCSPVKHSRKCCRNASRTCCSNTNVCVSRPGKHCAFPHCHSTESLVNVSCPQRCQGSSPRAGSWDLLERHSEYFTKSRKPFTPRTLISDAKPFLAECRCYNPARRKKKIHHKHRVEAQTQTEVLSFPCADDVYVKKVTSEQKITSEAEDKTCACDEPERGIDDDQCCNPRETSWCQKSSARRTVEDEEEELLYLTFIEDITNEILRLGIFSNRVLDQLFECHIEANKDRLDEGKMRQMLAVLKSDLGCSQDNETEPVHAGQEALEPLDEQEDAAEEHKCHRLRKATKAEDFPEAMDLSSKEPNKCESSSWSERSGETQSREGSSEDNTEVVDAGTESECCGVEYEEHPDASCEADLNFIACDSDLDINKELDELEQSFAEALHFSRNYS